MNTALRVIAAVVAGGLLVGAMVFVRTLPSESTLTTTTTTTTTTTRVEATLPDTVATLPPVTDPNIATSLSG